MYLLKEPTVYQARTNDLPESSDRAARRDAAFSLLVHRQTQFLYRIALSLLRNPQDAEDAVQETFLKLFRGDAWLQMENERAFLARAVWRVGLNQLARSGAKAMRHAEDVTVMNLAAPGDSPEDRAVDISQRRLLYRLIEALPEDLRQPLLLSAVEGISSAEVGYTLDLPEGTVRTRIMRARNELKRRFAAGTQGSSEVRR